MFRKTLSLSVAALFAFCLLPAGALADPDWELTPNGEVDFGDVMVGESSTSIFTITNLSGSDVLHMISVQVVPPGTDFAQTSGPVEYFDIDPLQTTDIEVTFAPSAVGPGTAVLYIRAEDGIHPQEVVNLQGNGVEDPGSTLTIDDILAFYDASVADGTLVANGNGQGRLKALRNKLVAAGRMIDKGKLANACKKLLQAYERSDGLPRPPDFVAGPAAPVLAGMIAQLMADMGCE